MLSLTLKACSAHKGVSFKLAMRTEFTPEEAALISRYKMGSYLLLDLPGHFLTPDSMAQGATWVETSVERLLVIENGVKKALDKLPLLFDVLRSFGGDEVVEYPRHRDDAVD